MTQHQKIIFKMLHGPRDKWWLPQDFMRGDQYFVGYEAPARLSELAADYPDMIETKQALTSLTKELVAEAKPGRADTQIWRENPDDAWDMAIDQFEQNLLKALEEV